MVLSALLLLGAAAEPRRVEPRPGDLIRVRPPIVRRDDQRSVVVEFVAEETLDRLVPAMDAGDVSLVQDRNRLFIKSLAPRGGVVDVIGASGTLYRLSLEPSDDADSVVQVAPPTDAEAPPSPVDFARSLRLGLRPPGAVVLDGGDELVAREDGVEFRLHRVVHWRSFRGFVIDCRNTESRPRDLDERTFRAEGLVAAGVTTHTIAPGESSRLVLVFWR